MTRLWVARGAGGALLFAARDAALFFRLVAAADGAVRTVAREVLP